MTTMELTELLKLGFNKNEAKVYLVLIKFGKSDAGQIIKETHFHKNIVYDNLEKLINRGLVSYILEGNKRIFQIVSSRSIVEYFEKEEEKAAENKKQAEAISLEINKISKQNRFSQEAEIYRGINGVRSFYNWALEKGKDFYVFGAPQSSVDIMGDVFWHNLEAKRHAKKMNAKMIFNPSLRTWGKIIRSKFTEIRYFKGDFEPLTETHIQEDFVAIIVWVAEPIVFLIKDKRVAGSYLRFFEDMWKQAKN